MTTAVRPTPELAAEADARFGGIADLDTIVTTSDAPPALMQDARAGGVALIFAEPGEAPA